MTAPVFVDTTLASASTGQELQLKGDEARHAIAVRRMRDGEVIHVVNGTGLRVIATVTRIDRAGSQLDFRVDQVVTEPAPRPRLTLVQALAKGGRDEAAVETACEVGVDRIIPWQASRSIVTWPAAKAQRRRERWQAIALAAAKQSRRAFIPEVSSLCTSGQLGELIAAEACWLILHESASTSIADFELPDVAEISVIVGPEGGISDEELASFEAAGGRAVLVGPHVMRASTAGPIALAHLASRLGRWRTDVD